MAKKTNKTHKLRGSREHGRGMKKGRGAGLRGGRGAGGWKHKKLHFLLYDQSHLRGKHGFIRHAADAGPTKAVSVRQVDEHAEAWLGQGSAAREGDLLAVDLGKMGYDKLVGSGQVTRKLALTVPRASEGAVKKVQAAGGKVTQTEAPEPAPKAAPPKKKGG